MLEINCLSTDAIYQIITNDLLDNLILNANTTIRKKKKRPDVTSMFDYLNKTVWNQGFTNQILWSRLSALTTDNKLEI